MFPRFEVVPAVDIADGQVVQLVGGDRSTATGYGDPVDTAHRWIREGARTLHVVDLDGAFDGERTNASVIADIVRAAGNQISIQVGGGIRTVEDAHALLDSGIDRVILGTAAVKSPGLVETITHERPGTVIVSLDARHDEVVIAGWTEGTGLDPADAACRFEAEGAAGILFTDVDVEGQLRGVRQEAVRRVAEAVDIPVIASGGVASLDDIRDLRGAGADAVVVGTALYEGTITLQAAMAATESDT